jgi:hypothetical protein
MVTTLLVASAISLDTSVFGIVGALLLQDDLERVRLMPAVSTRFNAVLY